MKILYLGTAAYEGIPSLFCNCRVCTASRAAGGRNLRSRSQALVDGRLLLDFPPDTVWHSQRFGLDWNMIGNCLITHSHSDHLYPEDIAMGRPDYCHGNRPMHYYAAEDGLRRIEKELGDTGVPMQGRITAQLVVPFEPLEVDGYRVLPLPADHTPATSPVFYAIEKEGKRLLYAHDTGEFGPPVWEALKAFGRFDLVSLDCTGGGQQGWRQGHMCLKTDREIAARMRREGLADRDTVFVANHFSHNGGCTHDELCSIAEKYHFVVAYDGLEIEF